MQIRSVSVTNFRSLKSFAWNPTQTVSCVIGPGDSGKSSLLDAIEACLSSRWTTLGDLDFWQCDTSNPIEIIVTVGNLPPELLSDAKFGLHLSGWSDVLGLVDEPSDENEAVLQVRLTVDATLEPVWEAITSRGETKNLSQRDRAQLGVVRVGGEVDRHLTWSPTSALGKLGADPAAATAVLANAYREARSQLGAGALPELDAIAQTVRAASMRFGSYAAGTYSAGLDSQKNGFTMGSLAVHEGTLPLRLSGLGSRRLSALAIQQLSIPNGAIILIDEIESGLEPHRLRHLLKVLKTSLLTGAEEHHGQVFLTTHSPVAIEELSCQELAIFKRGATKSTIRSPNIMLQPLIRRIPEALLSRKIIVCEGKTEVGLIRGLRESWATGRDEEPMENRGALAADGNGGEAVATALNLRKLGYDVVLFRDGDVVLTQPQKQDLATAHIPIIEWDGALATEERLFRDVSDAGVQGLLDIAYKHQGNDRVLDWLKTTLSLQSRPAPHWEDWEIPGKSPDDIRALIGTCAKKYDWFKRIAYGEDVGALLAQEISRDPLTSTAHTLDQVETWVYGPRR